MKPPITTLSPVWTKARVLIRQRRFSKGSCRRADHTVTGVGHETNDDEQR